MFNLQFVAQSNTDTSTPSWLPLRARPVMQSCNPTGMLPGKSHQLINKIYPNNSAILKKMTNYLHLLQKSSNHIQSKVVKSQVTKIVCAAFQHQNDSLLRSEADKLYRVLFHKPFDLSIVDFPISPIVIRECNVVLMIRAKAGIGSYCGIPCGLAISENITWSWVRPMGAHSDWT